MFDEKQVKKLKKEMIAEMKGHLKNMLEDFKSYLEYAFEFKILPVTDSVKPAKAKKPKKMGRPKKQA